MFFRAIYLDKTTVLIGQGEGLPNITGEFTSTSARNSTAQIGRGAFRIDSASENVLTGVGGGWYDQKISFDASRSNSIYGSSAHVTPYNATIKVWQRVS